MTNRSATPFPATPITPRSSSQSPNYSSVPRRLLAACCQKALIPDRVPGSPDPCGGQGPPPSPYSRLTRSSPRSPSGAQSSKHRPRQPIRPRLGRSSGPAAAARTQRSLSPDVCAGRLRTAPSAWQAPPTASRARDAGPRRPAGRAGGAGGEPAIAYAPKAGMLIMMPPRGGGIDSGGKRGGRWRSIGRSVGCAAQRSGGRRR